MKFVSGFYLYVRFGFSIATNFPYSNVLCVDVCIYNICVCRFLHIMLNTLSLAVNFMYGFFHFASFQIF